MAKGPRVLFIVTTSRSQPGYASLRPYPPPTLGTVTLQSHLSEAGFTPGTIVELRTYKPSTTVVREIPLPGQLGKRPRREQALCQRKPACTRFEGHPGECAFKGRTLR